MLDTGCVLYIEVHGAILAKLSSNIKHGCLHLADDAAANVVLVCKLQSLHMALALQSWCNEDSSSHGVLCQSLNRQSVRIQCSTRLHRPASSNVMLATDV